MEHRTDWLSALAAFESAARHQNFSHAAKEMHLSASAVSHHVRKLESRLGVTLFQRHARGVGLTPEGRQLADAAGSAMADIEDVVRGLRIGREDQQRVRLTTFHSLTYTWLVPRLHRFVAAHPQIKLNIDTEVALARFDDTGPDVGIRHGLGHWPGLTAIPLMDDAMFPVAAPGMPGIDRVRAPRDIASLPLVCDLARQGWHDWFRFADVHGVAFQEHYTFSYSTDAVNAAAHGLGAVLARKQIVAPYLASGRLVRLPGPTMPSRFGYYVVYSAHRRLRPPARAFVDWLLGEADS